MLDIRGPTPPGIAFILAAALMWWGIAKNSPLVVLVGGLFVMIGEVRFEARSPGASSTA